MPFVALLFGLLLIVVAYNDAAPALTAELEQDLQGYFKWAVAIVAILALGYIPGFRTPSRWLLGLVALVVVLTQFANMKAGFLAFTQSGGATTGAGSPQATPSAAYTAAYAPSAASAGSAGSGTAGSTPSTPSGVQIAAGAPTAAQLIAANPLSPSSYLSAAGAMGFGGIA